MEKYYNTYILFYKINKIENTECWDNNLSRPNLTNFFRNNPTYNRELLQTFLDKYTVINCPDEYFFFTIDFHMNFHHCIVEMIGQLYYYEKLSRNNKNIKILVKNNNFVIEYLKMLNFVNPENIVILQEDKLYYFDQIYLSKIKVKTKVMIKHMLDVNKFIIYKNPLETQYYKKIFIFRDNDKRKLVNSEEIISIAKKYDFYIYSPENDNLENQMKLILNCEILLCELGAGCCNMFFTNPKCLIIIMSFLKGWANKYLFYNQGILDRNMTVLDGKLINGNEHNCTWSINPKILSDYLEKIK